MTDIIQEIDKQTQFTIEERQEMERLLDNIQQKCLEIDLVLTYERWIAVGVHLINMLRRRTSSNSIPEIEDSMWEQISPEIRVFSENALDKYRGDFNQPNFCGEVFLLAVHFETAKMLNKGV